MKENKDKYFNRLALLLALITTIATVFGLYSQLKKEKLSLDVKLMSQENLSQFYETNREPFRLTYNGQSVRNLWRTSYLITNTGDREIIGKDVKKDIVGNELTFKSTHSDKILQARIENEQEGFELIKKDSLNFGIDFFQFLENEKISLTIYFEKTSKDSLNPSISFNNKQLINGFITYSKLSSNEDQELKVFEMIPKVISTPLKTLGIALILLVVMLYPLYYREEMNSIQEFQNWKSRNLNLFNHWKKDLIKQKIIFEDYTVEEFPEDLWGLWKGEEVDLPSITFSKTKLRIWSFLIMLGLIYPVISILDF